jgi:Mce-associated membrane protein
MAGVRTDVRGMTEELAVAAAGDRSEDVPTVGGRRWSRGVVLMGVVLVLMLAIGGTAAWKARQLDDVENARAAALREARARVPLLLSYRSATLSRDLDRAARQTTGSFSRDYRQILDEVVRPTASRDGVSTRATINASGVVSGDADQVVVLIFLTQTSTRTGRRTPAVSGSRVEVTMRPAGDSWKIAGLDPR